MQKTTKLELREFLNVCGVTVETWQNAAERTWVARLVWSTTGWKDFAGETRNEAINRLIDHLQILATELELFRDRRDADDKSYNTCKECGVEVGSACSLHPRAGVQTYRRG